MQSLRYLEMVRAKTATKTDYAIGKALGLPRENVANYLHGRRIMDNYACLRVAQFLQLPLEEIIAACEYDRAKDEGTRDVWTRFLLAAGARIRRRREYHPQA